MAPPLAPFEEAVRRHRGALVSFAYRLLRDPHEAEDAVQAALARALGSIRSGDVPANLRAWLYRFVHREVLRSVEKTSVRRNALRSGAIRVPGPDAAKDPGDEARVHRRVQAEVDRLPDDFRKIILLRFCQRLSHEEVSDVLEMPVGTVKSYQARALRVLRERLAGLLDLEV